MNKSWAPILILVLATGCNLQVEVNPGGETGGGDVTGEALPEAAPDAKDAGPEAKDNGQTPPAAAGEPTADPGKEMAEDAEPAEGANVSDAPTEYNELSEKEAWVILEKGTERAFTGEYTDLDDPGTYICRRCNAPLYKSDDKFHSNCGWPAFDDEIEGAVLRLPDADGFRTEIVCQNCGGHLGHVFIGEGFTAKDTRHCVNSVSMKFVPADQTLPPVVRKPSEKAADGDES